LFYFPFPGKFAQLPVNVAKNEQFLNRRGPVRFDVVEKPTKLDTASWEYVSQNGSADDVLAFLGRENVLALDLEKIAFRMKDRAFFEAVLTLLKERHVYQPTALVLRDLSRHPGSGPANLLHVEQIVAECAGPFAAPS